MIQSRHAEHELLSAVRPLADPQIVSIMGPALGGPEYLVEPQIFAEDQSAPAIQAGAFHDRVWQMRAIQQSQDDRASRYRHD